MKRPQHFLTALFLAIVSFSLNAQGPVAFIVFDAGETSGRRSRLYNGKDVYEDYLNEQIKWAGKAVKEPLFRKAIEKE